MGLVAGTLGLVAAIYYPWPQAAAIGQRVNEPLFAELKTGDVRNISVTSVRSGESQPTVVQLRRVRDQWVIPSANNYPAGNSALIGEINNALSQAIVLEVVTDEEGRHQFYGVIDPDSAGEAGAAGAGAKFTLANGENEPLASLIVGERVGQEATQRFVRIAGQPAVYVAEFNPNLLATRLADWADHNLLALKTSAIGPGFDVAAITIDHYAIPDDEFASGTGRRNYGFRLRLERSESAWQVGQWLKPNASGELAPQEITGNLAQAGLARVVGTLLQIPFDNVIQVPDAARQALTASDQGGDLSTLSNYGFRWNATSGGGEIESSQGGVSVSTPDGLELTLHLGRQMEPLAGSVQPTVAALLTARVNPETFPQPLEPEAAAGDEARREYDRSVKRREDSLGAATRAASQFNERAAAWLYFIPQAAADALRPNEEDMLQR